MPPATAQRENRQLGTEMKFLVAPALAGQVCQITYHRTARVGMTDGGPYRLTLDENIRALPVDGVAFTESADATPLSQDQIIIEMKFCPPMPALFKLVVAEFALNPVRASKYRLAARALGLVAGVDGDNFARANPQSLYA